jgi:hypothetical protein
MAVVVKVAGNQSAIDACKGPVLYAGAIIAQHDYCGGPGSTPYGSEASSP